MNLKENYLLDRLFLVITGLVSSIIIAFAFMLFIRWDLDRCYDMPPRKFHKQIENLNLGMSEDEAILRIKGYTEIKKEKDTVKLIMKPKRRGLIMPAIWQGITLVLDEERKVVKFYTWDG